MIAITTKFIGATNTKGERIAATTCSGQRIVIDWPYDKSAVNAHAEAALALCSKLGWSGKYHGDLVSGAVKCGYVFCFATADTFTNSTEYKA